MKISSHESEHAQRLVLMDQCDTYADRTHFRSTGHLYLNLQRCTDRQIVLTRHSSRWLANTLDHFARLGDLPTHTCVPGDFGHGIHCGAGI